MLTKELIRKALDKGIIDGDGHSIFRPEWYTNEGFDCEHLSEVLESNISDHKETIYKDGKVINSCKGIHTLTFLYWVAGECGLTRGDYEEYHGRGRQAQAIASALGKGAEGSEEQVLPAAS